jgi:dienelactone hydrolase
MRALLLAAMSTAMSVAMPAGGGGARGAPFPSSTSVESETKAYTLYEVRFPSPVKSPFEKNNTVWGHLYVPKTPFAGAAQGGKPPVVLALPIMAAPNVWVETRFAEAFVKKGIAVLMLEMPYQFHRVPAPLIPSGQVFLARKAKTLRFNFEQSVADARRAVSWLEQCGMVDAERIGLFGVSLGGIVSSVVYSRDDRPKAAVLFLAGADFPDLLFQGEMTAKFVRGAGIKKDDVIAAWKGLDPLEYEERNRGKRVLLINAKSDKVIPPANAKKLKKAFPDAEQIWVFGGHYTAIIHMLWTPRYAAKRFVEFFENK